MTPLMHSDIQAYNPAATDRRRSRRFPISEEVRFRMIDRRGTVEEGTGVTLDMSRNGLLFATETELTAGRLLEISVNWPVALNGTCPLKLVAVGHVVRSGGGKAAVRIERYQFKTRGRSAAAGRS